MPHLNNKKKQKHKHSHQQTGLPPRSALPIRGKTNTQQQQQQQQQQNSVQTSPCRKLTQTTGLTLGGRKPKGRENSTLKIEKRRPQTQLVKIR